MDGVTSGRIVTGRLARLAVWRYLDDLEHAHERGYVFEADKAVEFLNFSMLCCHTQGEWAGKPFIPEPWQAFCDWNLFGWRRADDGTRRFRKDYEAVARKNGKTTRCSPKCLYLSLMDNPIENGAQGYCVATKEDQAKLLFDEIKRSIDKSPAIKNYCQKFQKRIVFPSTQSYMQVLGSDSDSQDGFNPHFIVRDELHAWRERHRGLKEKLDTGFGSRRQPLMITITTYGDDQSVIWIEEHDYAVKVLESVITGQVVDDTLFAYVAAIDSKEQSCYRCQGPSCVWCGGTGTIPADDPLDERCWIKANPNLGVSTKIDRLREAANEARHQPTKMNAFLRYHCNVQVTATEKAISADAWKACEGELSDWSTADRIHGGFDLGRSNDMAGAAIMAMWRIEDDDGVEFTRYELRGHAWTCRGRHEDVQTPHVAALIARGFVSECDGDQVLFSDVEEWIVAQSGVHAVRTWAFDPDNAMQMGQRLENEHGLKVFPLPQNPMRYNEPTRTLLRALTEVHTVNGQPMRAFVHDGNPLLTWHFTNLVVRRNAKDQLMPDKGSSPQKIDAAVSGLMAMSECLFKGDEQAEWDFQPGSLAL